MPKLDRLLLTATALLACGLTLRAQSPATQPADVAQTQPAAEPVTAFSAVVLKVEGRVKAAPVGTEATDKDAWKPVEAGQTLAAGTVVRTSVRSQAVLKFADDTVALVESTSLVALMELYSSARSDRVRLGLGYGAIRAGTAEDGRKSEITIETPNAVLSREGTWGYRISYNAGSGEFHASLADSGLVIIRSQGGQRLVLPGTFVTQQMLKWIQTEPFIREVKLQDELALSDSELLFNQENRGTGTLLVGGGLANRENQIAGGRDTGGRQIETPADPTQLSLVFRPTRQVLRGDRFGTITIGPRIGDVLGVRPGTRVQK